MKQYDVKISHAALSDMEQIYSYIADRLLEPDTAMGQYNRIAEAIIPLTKLWAIRIWQRMCCKRCFCTLREIFLKFIEKTVTNSLLISLVVVEAVLTICV